MLTVQDLLEGHGSPVTVTADTPVTEALHLMIEHEFSQLPVVDAENHPLGLLSTDSLMRASRHFDLSISALRVGHALDEHVSTYRLDDDLSDLLDDLGNRFAVLILDGHGALNGILTTYDAMAYFRRHTEDIVWAKDAEDNLKESCAPPLPRTTAKRTPRQSQARSRPSHHRRRNFAKASRMPFGRT